MSKVIDWLLSLDASKAAPTGAPGAAVSAAPAPVVESLYSTSTGDDYEEFRKHLCEGKRPFRKPGISVMDEYELWLAARAKVRAKAHASSPSA